MFRNLRVRLAARRLIAEARRKEMTLALAESCTGGWVAKALTDIPGSSDVLWGGLVVYSNAAKMEWAGVRPLTLERHGAVSEETVRELTAGCLHRYPVSLACAISGVAGPSGGSKEKPRGSVWISVQAKGKASQARLFHFKGSRRSVRLDSVLMALRMLTEELENLDFTS
jgi:nicotinamide-nucleotide amidase